MRFAFIAIPFLIKLYTRQNLFSNNIFYLLFVHCRVYMLLLTEFSHLQKLTFVFCSNIGVSMAWGEELSAYLRIRIVDVHKNWKRYKVIFKQFLVPVSTFLTIMKKYREFQTVDNPERRGKKQKLSSRNVRKIVWDQFQPKFVVNITFPFIKFFQVNITEVRGQWEKKLHRLQTKKATSSTGYANKISSIFCD